MTRIEWNTFKSRLIIMLVIMPSLNLSQGFLIGTQKALRRTTQTAQFKHQIYLKSFHSTTRLYLNRFLFDVSELQFYPSDRLTDNKEGKKVDSIPTVILPATDYRTIHASKILRLVNGDTIRAGIVLDQQKQLPTVGVQSSLANQTCNPIDSDHDPSISGKITDEAVITWIPEGKVRKAEPLNNGDPPGSLMIRLDSLQTSEMNNIIGGEDSPFASPVSLILALPRPIQLERILPMISQIGVDHLVLCSAQKVPKDYFGSHLFRRPGDLRCRLIEGLCQAGDVRLPKITIARQLKKFLDHDLDDMFPSDRFARVIAHPLRKNQKLSRMRDVHFPCEDQNQRRVILAVGPEGGWAEPYELDLFKEREFQQITLGSRILRSDVAVISLLSLAHDLCSQ